MGSVEEREGDRIIGIDHCLTGNGGHPKTLLSSSQHTQTFAKWSYTSITSQTGRFTTTQR